MNKKLPKSRIWNKIIFTISFTCFITFLNAQPVKSWTLDSTLNGVKFSYRVDTCSKSHFIFFKFENTTSSTKLIHYQVMVTCQKTHIPLMPQALQLNANETKAGNCDTKPFLSGNILETTSPWPKLRVMLLAVD